MPRTTARHIPTALVILAALALPVHSVAATRLATPLAPASRSVDRLWSWIAELWGTAGVAAPKRPAAGQGRPSVLIGKLGGFLDPNGVRLLNEPTSTVELHP